MICDLLIRKDMSTAFNEALIDSGIQVNIHRENKDYDWEAEIITKEHDDKVIAKFIGECNRKLDELERNYKSCYGVEIIEMYAEVYEDFRTWLKEQNK